MSTMPAITPEYLAENDGGTLFAVSVVFVVLPTIFTCLFCVARYLKKTLWSLDVLFILLGYGWTLTLAILGIVNVKSAGAGRHIIAVVTESLPKLVLWLKIELAIQYCYVYAVTFPKLAILHLYLHIFNKVWYRRVTYATIAVVVVNAIVLTIVGFVICRPFEYNWNKSIPGGYCGNLFLLYKLASIPNIVTDVVVLILPIPIIWKLNVKTGQKIGLLVTFLTASFGMITAIIRLHEFFVINENGDLTYNSVTLMSWTIVEPASYLIAAILPSLRPLLRTIGESRAYSFAQSHIRTITPDKRRSQTYMDSAIYNVRPSSEKSDEIQVQRENSIEKESMPKEFVV